MVNEEARPYDGQIPFSLAKPAIFPRIFANSKLGSIEVDNPAYQEFVNDTSIFYFTSFPDGRNICVQREDMDRWGLKDEDILGIARENLEKLAGYFDVKLLAAKRGKVAFYQSPYGDSSSYLLHPNLHLKLAPELGVDFYAAIPWRDRFMAFTADSEKILGKMFNSIGHSFVNHPDENITPRIFVVTRDGIAGMKPD